MRRPSLRSRTGAESLDLVQGLHVRRGVPQPLWEQLRLGLERGRVATRVRGEVTQDEAPAQGTPRCPNEESTFRGGVGGPGGVGVLWGCVWT